MLSYVELHRHSQKSHDASGKPEWAAEYALSLEQTALGVTEHGNIDSLIEHDAACRAVGVHPVLGCEIYFQPTFKKGLDTLDDQPPEDADDQAFNNRLGHRFHMGVLCRNMVGYQNLCRMLTEANEQTFYRVPIVTLDNLRRHGEGLIILTGCISGYVAQCILSENAPIGLAFIEEMQRIVGVGNVYLEVQPFDAPGQKEVNTVLCVWHDIYQWPMVMTSDAHFVRPEHYAAHQVMQMVRKPYMDGVMHDFSMRHIHSAWEMYEAWCGLMGTDQYVTEAINNTQAIANRCDVTFDKQFKMPNLNWLDDRPDELLPKLVGDGLRAMGKVASNSKGKQVLQPSYMARVVDEIKVMSGRGFIPYMLLVHDIVQYCHDHGIMVNGRGSGCGSEVAHALGFHLVDCVKYDVNFATFISPTRETFPDFDLDVEDSRKQEVVDYVIARYPGQAVQISTSGTFKQKGVINGIVKHSTMDAIEAETFRSELLDFPDIDIPLSLLLHNSELAALEAKYGVVSVYCYIYGQVSFTGTHPAGIAITQGPVSDYLAVKRVGSGSGISYVTCYDMAALDVLGILKIDLLGLNTLTVINDALQMAGVTLDADKIEQIINDKEMLNAFSMGHTLGIFQSERRTPRQMYRDLKPSNILDLAIVSACNRPLPLQEKTFEIVVAGKFPDPKKKKAMVSPWAYHLPDTYGGIVYQDQVRELCITLAGMTPAQADEVLMGLKRYHVNDPTLQAVFVDGCCVHGGLSKHDAQALWEATHRYLFKKAHAMAYAILAALQQWLKINYPQQFYLSVLRHEEDKAKRRVYEADALRHGIPILLPHVNGDSEYQAVTIGNIYAIQQGLTALPGVGPSVASAILAERDKNGLFSSQDDCQKRLPEGRYKLLERFGAVCYGQEYMRRTLQFQDVLADVSSSV